MKVALYCRSSIESQEHSIETQKTMAYLHATKHSLLIDEEYIDEGVSAAKTKIEQRPNFSRLIQDIKRGEVKTLFVYKRDRLARNIQQHLEIFELFRQYDIQVIFTASSEFPLSYTPVGEFFELVLAGFNQREAEQIKLRIRETKRTLFLEEKNHGGKIPYGYSSDAKKKIQRDEQQLGYVKNIYDELIRCECKTFKEFIRLLEEKGDIPKELVENNKLRNIIITTEYMGIRRATFGKEVVEIQQERLSIISEVEWNSAQEKLRSLTRKRSRNKDYKSLLEGLVYCFECQAEAKVTMILMQGKQIAAYKCPNHSRNRVAKNAIESGIWEHALNYVAARAAEGDAFMELIRNISETEINHKRVEIDLNISLLRDKVNQLTEVWLLDKDSAIQEKMIDCFNSLSRLETQKRLIRDFKETINNYPQQIKDLNIRMKKAADNMDLNQKKEYCKDVVERVLLKSNGEVEISLKNPWIESRDGGKTLAFTVVD